MKKIIFPLAFILLVIACHTVPLTGRSQFLGLVPKSQALGLSFSQYKQVMTQSKISTNQKYVSQVKRVGNKIQSAVETYYKENGIYNQISDFRWEYNVIEEDQLNAWCMPGGKVAFYTGIMPVCGTDDGVAVVMGHEIAHALANHGQERMNQQLLTQLGGVGLSVAMANKPQQTQQLAMTAFGLGSQFGVLLPFSRKHESEADELGLIFMSKAGYNPNEAPKFWVRMEKESARRSGGNAQRPAEFMSTHPHPENRIKALNNQIPRVMPYYLAYHNNKK